MTKIELTDAEAEEFKLFRQHKQDKELRALEHQNWKQLKELAESMQYGVFTVIIKDGIPVRVDNPIKQVLFGVAFKL